MDGPPVLQQLMIRDGYEPVWSPIPAYRRPLSANRPPSAAKREAAEVLAKQIVAYLLQVGTDTTLGTPTRLAFKYRDASDQEREGGGLGEPALIREIARAIQLAE